MLFRERKDQRRKLKQSCHALCIYGISNEVEIQNISKGGLMFVGKVAVKAMDIVFLNFHLPDKKGQLVKVIGQIVWNKDSRYGVKFQIFVEGTEKKIEDFFSDKAAARH